MVDLAGAKVELDDGSLLPTKTFEDYVKLYTPRMCRKISDRLEVCVCSSPEGIFEQVSFVNGIATMKGGSLVDHITSQITDHLAAKLGFKQNDIKNCLWVFINATVDEPDFDSQTKLKLVSDKESFGSTFQLPPCFLNETTKSDWVSRLLSSTDFNQNEELEKTDGERKEKLDIPELDDAYLAATADSRDCTLILTQGVTAKMLAGSALSGNDQDNYGLYPLSGELLNVREASLDTNAEFQNIMKILGLRHGEIYENVDKLRYGHLMIMAHQNHGGSRIIGLLINFLHFYWPSLLKVPKFLWTLITPIVKASNKKLKKVFRFYTMPEYEAWKKKLGNEATEYKIEYYMGMPSLSASEIQRCLADTDQKNKVFSWDDDYDSDSIELAFSKQKIMDRKDWILKSKPAYIVDIEKKHIRYRDFIYRDYGRYLVADLQRSIPSMVDGLKAHERSILFCAFKEPFIQKIDVAQFSDYVFGLSAYHHGDVSLVGTIVGMAQNYVGSNNINLLQPNGQFGTRPMGGNDHASGEYLFTQLSPITRYLFHEDDELLLEYLEDSGQTIEPAWFIPIIPMVLVNGSEGTGCAGWSSFIPNHNPRDIISNLKRLLNGEAMVPMLPWYKGFKGDIQKTASEVAQYLTTGNYEVIEDENALSITELPVRIWTQDYEEFLEAALQDGKDKTPFIKSYTSRYNAKTVDIKIFMTRDQMKTAEQEGFQKKFKLTNTLSTANMHLFDANGELKKYDTPEQILKEFFDLRLKFYVKRRDALLLELKNCTSALKDKVKYFNEVLEIKEQIRKELDGKGLEGETREDLRLECMLTECIPITDEIKQELQRELDEKQRELDALTKTLPKDLWLADLAALEQQLKDDFPASNIITDSDEESQDMKRRKRGKATRKRKQRDRDLDHQLDGNCPSTEIMARNNFQSSQDDNESSPEITEEAPKKKARAKEAAAGTTKGEEEGVR